MADMFGTKHLGGFAYYDRMPDLGRPTSADSDQSNIAAPFVVVFDKNGVRSIGNVGTDMEENQQGLSPQMMMSKSKSDIHYFFIFLRPTQAMKAEQLWFDAEYCDLYEYLKEIALTEEGAFAGEDGQSPPPSAKLWFERKDIRATEAVMNIHCEPDEEEEPEKPSLGSLNWVSFSSENRVQGRIGLHDFLVWGARDGRSRVLGSPMDDWIWDEGEFEDEEQYEEFQRQVEQFGAYSLRHEIWDDEIDGWDYIDHITGIVPSEDYDLIQAAHEFFDLKNPILLGGMNWISLRAEDFPEDEIGLLNWRWDGWKSVRKSGSKMEWDDWDDYYWDERSHTPPPAAAAAAETFKADVKEQARLQKYEKTYGVEGAKVRNRIFKRILANEQDGTKAGQWSARKAQSLTEDYEKAMKGKGKKPYKSSKKTKSQKDLKDWGDQDWTTKSGKKSSKTGERYLPKKAIKALSDKEYKETSEKKRKDTKKGKQFSKQPKKVAEKVKEYRAERFEAYTMGDTYTAAEVYEIASSSQMRGPQSWDYQHYENPEDDRLLRSILRTPEWEIIRFDESVLREKPITHADCWIGTFYWPEPIRSNTPIVIQDGTVVDGNHRLASALTWGQSVLAFVPKGEEWWIEWFDEDEMKEWNDDLDELLKSSKQKCECLHNCFCWAMGAETFQSTQSGVNSKYSPRSGTDVEEFSVPFIDISNQDADGLPTEEIICVDHLYHGQYSMGGEEITAHSPYWSPNLDFALGHALFGAELEKMVPATRCEYCYEECDKCEEGWVLLNRETDDIIPQTMPMVLQLNFDTEEEICFAQDIEHEKGQSYVLYGESSGWEIVPSNQLIPILEKWLEDEEIPEDILFDTGAGYVSDDRIVWNRVEQAIQQLQN